MKLTCITRWVWVAAVVLLVQNRPAPAQVTNSLGQTNTAALTPATNRGDEVLPPGGREIAAPTNHPGASNEALQTNLVAQTNALVEINQPRRSEFGNSPERWRADPESATTNAPSQVPVSNRLEYAWFRLIPERNIFNPNRYPRSGRFDRAPRESSRPRSSDSFWLIGTMSYDKGYFAFFDGSRYDFRKTVKPDETIGGYRVTEVGHNHVKLASKTNELEMKMGMRMRREDEGDWMLLGANDLPPNASMSFSSTAQATPPPGTEAAPAASGSSTNVTSAGPSSRPSESPASSSGGESDILKKLMQRREQELNK